MPILVYAENSDGRFKKSTLEAISYARVLADRNADTVIALSVQADAAELASLGKAGANRVLVVNGGNSSRYLTRALAAAAKMPRPSSSAIPTAANSLPPHWQFRPVHPSSAMWWITPKPANTR
jgi:electron transfer flavoprotein alpha subunit